jgi:ribosomal protein L17
MRHQQNTKKFKRTPQERRRLKIDLSKGLIKSGKITTFTARGKWFRPFFERLVTYVKRSEGNANLAFSKLRPYLDEKTARKLIEEIAPKLTQAGGYTSQIKVFASFNEHDKSIISISYPVTKTSAKSAKVVEESPTEDVITDVEVKKVVKKTVKKIAAKVKKTVK